MIHIKLHINECLQVNFTGIVEWSNGMKCWYKEGKFHRDNGPAIEWDNGFREWWLEGKLHREDGPAIEYYSEYEHEDHADYREWYLKGKTIPTVGCFGMNLFFQKSRIQNTQKFYYLKY